MPKKQAPAPNASSAPVQLSPSGAPAPFSVQDARNIFQALSMMGTRGAVAAYLGKSFGGDRDIYEALGYTKLPQFGDFYARYRRQDIAKAVIDVPINASWRKPPEITEVEDDETEFEKRWKDLAKRLKIWNYFSRADRLSAIGEYSVLLIGFNDAAQLWQPVKRATDVLYVMPYSQINAQISKYVTDTKDPRYSLPEEYSIQMRTTQGTQATASRKVHWSRIIHISEDNLEDDMLGLPRLEAPLNRLQDLDLVSGGSGEMFWRGAFPGFGLKADENYQFNQQNLIDIQNEADEYVHKMRRFMRLVGVTIEQIQQQVSSPKDHADLYITLIAAVTRIPKRILLGSEMGELASSQDEANWYARIDERRELHCEPVIVREFIDRCIAVGVLPTPRDQYTCKWPPLLKQSAKEKSDVAKTLSEAIATYVNSGAATLMPPDFYFREVMGYSQDQVDQIEEMLEGMDIDADGNPADPEPNPDDSQGDGGGADE